MPIKDTSGLSSNGIGKRVRESRLASGLTQRQLGELAGAGLRLVSELERGKPTLRMDAVNRVLAVFGLMLGPVEAPRRIMDVADHRHARVCWNSNPEDLLGQGLEHNFNLVKDRLGATVHIHDLISDYPWRELFHLLKQANYEGWTLLEESKPTSDPIRVMKYYRLLWETMALSG